MKCSSVNYLSALAATVAAFAFGWVWYHDAVWGAVLTAASGVTPDNADMTSQLVVEFIKLFVTSVAVAAIAAGMNLTTAADAFRLSLVIGLGIVGVSIISGLHWAGKPPVVAVIDVGYSYVTILLFSLFGCVWRKG